MPIEPLAHIRNARGILVYIPWPSNTGYAMHRAESQLFEMARRLTLNEKLVHFAFTSLDGGQPTSLPSGFRNLHEVNFRDVSAPERIDGICRLVTSESIDVVFGYDLPVVNKAYGPMRRSGVSTIVAYWGAPMSSLNNGLRLLAKRLQVRASVNRPDHFIFQSMAMQATAVNGRGIPRSETSVVKTGVNTAQLSARDARASHVHEAFGIERHRRIVVFSGHVHERKGIHVLLQATTELVKSRGRDDIHVVILGEVQDISRPFVDYARTAGIDGHVTFAGYRADVFRIFSGCHLGVVPTTGWDSFPRSVLEMQGTGLPVIVSNCQGLPEMVVDGVTGAVCEVGNVKALADKIAYFVDDEQANLRCGHAARARIVAEFSEERQIQNLVGVVSAVHAKNRRH